MKERLPEKPALSEEVEKRPGGQVIKPPPGKQLLLNRSKWLVLTESVKEEDKDGVFWRHTCGTELEDCEVTHPIWFRGFGAGGGGEVFREHVPYCPHCEIEPKLGGSPIVSDFPPL
ncbi:hypothetical protein HY389_00085 [Candidatus Daviesbacteria bacterium]|nr:hypothetical protein [Candidatus Daviesbacteria bacterium]